MVVATQNRRAILEKTYVRLGLVPTEAQWPALMCDERTILVAGGERGGKSRTGAAYLMGRWHEGQLFWIAAKDYERCRPEFEYCLGDAQKLGILTSDYSFPARDQCHTVLLGGTKIVTKSLRDYVKIGSEAPDGILVCEVAQLDYQDWLRLLARTAEKRAWLLGTGTFEGSLGWYPELVEYYSTGVAEGKSFSIPSWSNRYVFPGGRDDSEIKRLENLLPYDLFMERFGGVPCKPSGLVIKEFANRIHVGQYDFKPELTVEIAVDPGYAGACAVEAIQKWGEQMVLVDEIYLQGYVTEEIIDICKMRSWWSRVVGGAIDVAARQHQAMAAPIEVWLKHGSLSLQAKLVEEEAGIDLLRTYLKPHPVSGQPHILVNHNCQGFIAECGGGKNPIPGGGQWLRDKNTGKPIDKDNHACKAVIYYLANKFGYTVDKVQPRRAEVRYDL